MSEGLNPDAQAARVSLSLKPHGGFDAPLINFSGGNVEEIKRQIAEVFGFDPASVADQTAFGLLVDAHDMARAAYVAHEGLGATVDASQKKSWGNGGGAKVVRSQGGSAAPSPTTPAAEPEDPNQVIADLIAGATSIPDLSKVWVKNKTGNTKEHNGWPTAALAELATAKAKDLEGK